ncbi:MAG: TonB-dependent receptor [Alphaproteobacteria bacterium]|nr:MAG: TonB-dependent receptor [Alphaproteobacteria bacterium]
MRRLLLLSGAAFAPFSPVFAQASPAPAPAPAPPASPAGGEEIVVRAQPEQRTAIDRDTYTVRDTAEARSSNALDILGRIPAVTVQPDNSIRLLGTSGVTVLVDGRPSPNPNILRDLQGSEIARIEVVSNPSAQFSASGTGGIINIITRRNALNGLRGSATASASRYGGTELRASPTWTHGDWTLSGNLGWTRDVRLAEVTRERLSLDPAGTAPDTIETQDSRSRFEFVNGNGQISYRPTDKRTITFQGGMITADARTTIDSVTVSSASPGAPLAQRITSDFDYDAYNASLEYREEGSRQGELLTTSIQQYRFDPTSEVTTDFGAGEFRFHSDAFTRARIFKLDYVRPLRGRQRLLVGGSINDTHDFNRLEQGGDLPLGGNPFPPVSTIDGTTLEVASYASFQFPLLGGTMLAGLRIESRDYDFADPSLGEGPSDAHLFPSMTLERRLARWLTGTLSYSRRVAWPAIQQLSPALRFSDATTANAGNPALRPELTDAIEAKLRAETEGQTISLTLFHRRTDDLFSFLNTLTDDGVLVSQPVNVGQRTDRGAALAVQGPIVRGFTYSINANLIDRRIERDFGIFRVQHSTNYSGTAQIDYRDGSDGRRGADRITVTANYSGPYNDGLVSNDSYFRASASWSHAITDRLSSVVTVDDIFGPTEFRRSTISDTALTRTTNVSDGPRFKLALTYSLGRPGQPQPPAPAGPSVPVPGVP